MCTPDAREDLRTSHPAGIEAASSGPPIARITSMRFSVVTSRAKRAPWLLAVSLVCLAVGGCSNESSPRDTSSAASAEDSLSGRYEPGPPGYLSAWFSGGLRGLHDARLLTTGGEEVEGTYEVIDGEPSVLRLHLSGGGTADYRLILGTSLGAHASSRMARLADETATDSMAIPPRCEPTTDVAQSLGEGGAGANESGAGADRDSEPAPELLASCQINLFPGLQNVVTSAEVASAADPSAMSTTMSRAGGAPLIAKLPYDCLCQRMCIKQNPYRRRVIDTKSGAGVTKGQACRQAESRLSGSCGYDETESMWCG